MCGLSEDFSDFCEHFDSILKYIADQPDTFRIQIGIGVSDSMIVILRGEGYTAYGSCFYARISDWLWQ